MSVKWDFVGNGEAISKGDTHLFYLSYLIFVRATLPQCSQRVNDSSRSRLDLVPLVTADRLIFDC